MLSDPPSIDAISCGHTLNLHSHMNLVVAKYLKHHCTSDCHKHLRVMRTPNQGRRGSMPTFRNGEISPEINKTPGQLPNLHLLTT